MMQRAILARMGRVMTALAVGILLTAGAASPALAQFAPSAVYQAWSPAAKTTLAVTAVSANVALPKISGGAVPPVALICNTGTKDAFIRFGTSNAITATTSTFLLKSGACRPYATKPFGTQFTYVAAIAGGSDSTSLDIETGIGSP